MLIPLWDNGHMNETIDALGFEVISNMLITILISSRGWQTVVCAILMDEIFVEHEC
jgi:hypothetical protein